MLYFISTIFYLYGYFTFIQACHLPVPIQSNSCMLHSGFSVPSSSFTPFTAPMIGSISTYDSYAISISIATPHLALTVAPIKDITAPAPTIKTNDYGVYLTIPDTPLTDTTSPFVYQTPPPTFVPTVPNILYK